MHKTLEYINHLICKFSEWIVSVSSFVLYQIGIPLEVHVLVINPYLASAIHGLISMIIPVGSYWLIHISKELRKDPESWLSIAFNKSVYVASFKWLKRK